MSCSKALSPSHARRHSWPGPGLPNPGPHPPHNPLAAGRAARLVRDNPPPFSDLTHAIDVAHRPHFAQRLYGACTSWIQQSMRPPFAPFTPARPPVHLLALQGALYVLRKGLCPSEEASPLHAPPALAHTVSAFAQLFCALHAPDLAQRRRQLAALRDRVEADALLSMHREDAARALQGLLSVCLHDGGGRADGPGGPGGPGHGRPGRHAP